MRGTARFGSRKSRRWPVAGVLDAIVAFKLVLGFVIGHALLVGLPIAPAARRTFTHARGPHVHLRRPRLRAPVAA